MSLIDVRDLSIVFDNRGVKVPALDRVSFRIEPGGHLHDEAFEQLVVLLDRGVAVGFADFKESSAVVLEPVFLR